MMMRRLGLTALALLCAGAALADPPPATAPPYRPSSGALIPVAIYDAAGNVVNTFGGGSGGGGTVAGSQEQDVRASQPLSAATANAALTYVINGQATVGFTFTGLTASGATLTYEQSIDGGTTWTGINAINRGTGVPEATRATDGQIALSATGRTNIRVRVSTAGTGTITVASNVSVREGIFSLGSPLPPGSNAIGSVTVANPTAAGSVTSPGTSGSQAQAVQGVTGGVPMPIQGGNGTAVKTDGSGVTQPIVQTPTSAIAVQRTTGIGTTGVQVSAIDAVNRRTVTNTSAIACELMGSAAAYGTGYPLPGGSSFTFDASGRTTAALFVACASSGGTVAVLSY